MPRVRARAPGPAVLYARELASALQDVGAPLDSADGTSKSSAPPQSGPVMLRLSGVSARRDRRPAGALSGGTQQKLNVALAQLDSPDLLLLDEPYQGLDALAYEDLWTLISSWRDSGAGVPLVTHILRDVDLVDRVVELPAPKHASKEAA